MYSGYERKSLTNECAQQTEDQREKAPTKQPNQTFKREHSHTHNFWRRISFVISFVLCLCMWSLDTNRRRWRMAWIFGVGFSLIFIYIWWNIENCKWCICNRAVQLVESTIYVYIYIYILGIYINWTYIHFRMCTQAGDIVRSLAWMQYSICKYILK